jgi:hypothetical protein
VRFRTHTRAAQQLLLLRCARGSGYALTVVPRNSYGHSRWRWRWGMALVNGRGRDWRYFFIPARSLSCHHTPSLASIGDWITNSSALPGTVRTATLETLTVTP